MSAIEADVHAFCSPSGAERWMACPGAPALEEGRPDTAGPDAAFGTVAHDVAARWLATGKKPSDAGPEFDFLRHYIEYVESRVNAYKEAGAGRVEILIEKRLDISAITTERGAMGTADCILIVTWPDGRCSIDVIDLKTGMGVEVSAVENKQLMIYALAAVLVYSLLSDFKEVNIVISQPRIREQPSEWMTTVDDLYAFGQRVTEAASIALTLRGDVAALSNLNPGEVQCRWCRAKSACPALQKMVHDEVFGEFQAIEDPAAVPLTPDEKSLDPKDRLMHLARSMARVPLIEKWCLAIRAEVERELLDGHPVEGFKLVEGRKGPRKWTDEEAVIGLLNMEGFTAADMYNRSLKSPAQLDKAVSGRTIAESLKELVSQSEGKPSVAPVDDPRPEYTPAAASDFDTYNGEDLV